MWYRVRESSKLWFELIKSFIEIAVSGNRIVSKRWKLKGTRGRNDCRPRGNNPSSLSYAQQDNVRVFSLFLFSVSTVKWKWKFKSIFHYILCSFQHFSLFIILVFGLVSSGFMFMYMNPHPTNHWNWCRLFWLDAYEVEAIQSSQCRKSDSGSLPSHWRCPYMFPGHILDIFLLNSHLYPASTFNPSSITFIIN